MHRDTAYVHEQVMDMSLAEHVRFQTVIFTEYDLEEQREYNRALSVNDDPAT